MSEYYANITNAYLMTTTPKEFTAMEIATDMYESGVLNKSEYRDIILREGAEWSHRDNNAVRRLKQMALEKGIDAIVYMNSIYDPGSIGVIPIDESNLTLVSVDGKTVDTDKNVENVDERGYNEININIEREVNNYSVKLPDGTISKLTEGTNISDIEVFAGKGSNSELRVRYHLVDNYGGNAENWQHVKGRGFVDTIEGPKKAMLHWFEEETVGIVEMFVKGWSKK